MPKNLKTKLFSPTIPINASVISDQGATGTASGFSMIPTTPLQMNNHTYAPSQVRKGSDLLAPHKHPWLRRQEGQTSPEFCLCFKRYHKFLLNTHLVMIYHWLNGPMISCTLWFYLGLSSCLVELMMAKQQNLDRGREEAISNLWINNPLSNRFELKEVLP